LHSRFNVLPKTHAPVSSETLNIFPQGTLPVAL